jgi:xylose dehydrogenase (NAD/NADP)
MIRWGFLGASWVASTAVAGAVHSAPNASLFAVASRDPERSRLLSPEKVHLTYEDLLADPNVDAVYISLANHLHFEWTVKALNAGKHVLCEKPFAISFLEAQAMAQAAKENERLLIEAIWTRWHPRFQRAVELVKGGDIGELTSVDCAFTFTNSFKGNYRLQPSMGGGSLLDVGPYQIHAWSALITDLIDVQIDALERNIGPTGIDLTTSVEATHRGIRLSAHTSFEKKEEQCLLLSGENGTIEFSQGEAFTSWKEPSTLKIGNVEESFLPVDPFALMIENFGERIYGENAWLSPLAESLRVMGILDQIKKRI